MSKVVNLVRLRGVPIFRQLLLEESLLRGSQGNWCVLNDGAPELSIVMGISAKVDQVLHRDLVNEKQVKVIRRYSGGGTVIIDEETLFATLIFEQKSIPDVTAYPRPIMKWSEGFYSSVFSPWGSFGLKENDYAFENRKFGGNAQTITKDKWVHHTSFLWDYDRQLMALLKQPPKQPEYRKVRNYSNWPCSESHSVMTKSGKNLTTQVLVGLFMMGMPTPVYTRQQFHSIGLLSTLSVAFPPRVAGSVSNALVSGDVLVKYILPYQYTGLRNLRLGNSLDKSKNLRKPLQAHMATLSFIHAARRNCSSIHY